MPHQPLALLYVNAPLVSRECAGTPFPPESLRVTREGTAHSGPPPGDGRAAGQASATSRPYFAPMGTNSTRRLASRPAAVAFVSIGRVSP